MTAMLDPRTLSSIADLEMVARVTVEGSVAGLHRSPFHGYSAEFSQYRHYRPGDDLKYVDWKLLARTDRIYTKQYRETTNLAGQMTLDASASMGYRDRAGTSKLEYARLLAAALSYLLASQGDAVGLVVYDRGVRQFVGSRRGQAHLRSLLVALSRVQPSGATSTAAALRRAAELLGRRGLMIVLSDICTTMKTGRPKRSCAEPSGWGTRSRCSRSSLETSLNSRSRARSRWKIWRPDGEF